MEEKISRGGCEGGTEHEQKEIDGGERGEKKGGWER